MRNKVLVLFLAFAIQLAVESKEKESRETSHDDEVVHKTVTSAMGSPQEVSLTRKKTKKRPNSGKGKGKGKKKNTAVPAKVLDKVDEEYGKWLTRVTRELLHHPSAHMAQKFLNEFKACGPHVSGKCIRNVTSAIYSCRNADIPLLCVQFKIMPTCLGCISRICEHIPIACPLIPSLCCHPDLWKPTNGSDCYRDCTKFTDKHEDFKECRFTFTAKNQYSDKNGRKADGRNRTVLTYNGTIPGPSIVVCELDKVVVHLENRIEGTFQERQGQSNGTTLHFHGIRHWNASIEDGAPGVNQCEVESGGNFTYTLIGDDYHENAPPGTYWYHSHVGSQRTNGLYGSLIIKPRSKSPLYDVDDAYNTLVLQEWYETDRINIPKSILINGNGRVSEMEELMNSTTKTNYTEFDVEYGKRYRFRIIGAISQNFPLCVKIQAHTFTAIATDSIDFKPQTNVDAVCLAAGERYDIVIKTKKKPKKPKKNKKPKKFKKNAYKIKVFGHNSYSIPLCTVAWLKYPGQKVNYDYVTNSKCAGFNLDSSKKVLNPVMGTDFKNTSQHITINELKGKIQPKTIDNTFTNKHYVEMNDLTFNNMEMTYNDIPFLFQSPANIENRCGPKCDQQFSEGDLGKFSLNFTCDDSPKKPDHCSDEEPCQCEHIVHQAHVPAFIGEFYWFETILINPYNSRMAIAHPIHQHGGWYSVLAVKQFDINTINITKEYIMDHDKCTTKENCLPRNLEWPVQKDTIQVPVNGYVIFRTATDNAGTWLVHCHINHHVESGMAMVFEIGGLPTSLSVEYQGVGSLPLGAIPPWSQDWTLGPYKDEVNKTCPRKLNTYQNPDAINWFYGMKPIVACADPGHSITFRWLYGHNVNIITEEVWKNCGPFSNNETLPTNGDWTWPGNMTTGTYFFACGVGDHCKNGGLKAKITVPCE